jgi:hypothetical protein
MAREIFGSLQCFYDTAMVDPTVWQTHLPDSERQRYKWSNNMDHAYVARESSLFRTHKPVIEYSEKTELNEPLQKEGPNANVSMKEMCAGLLGQVYFTIPLAANEKGQWVPTTLQSMDAFYNPYTGSSTPNITSLEDFMLNLLIPVLQASWDAPSGLQLNCMPILCC